MVTEGGSADVIRLKGTLSISHRKAKRKDLTYILGSRCIDGVVLVADRKFTVDSGSNYLFVNKLFGGIKNMIVGFSGSRGTFELFKTSLRDRVADYELENGKTIPHDKFILQISETMERLNHKYHSYEDKFDAMIAIGAASSKATLQYFYPDGKLETIPTCKAIGTGAPYGEVFLHKEWSSMHEMEKIAEVGYFIIKYIEKFELDLAVGTATLDPQIWFIPDNSDKNYELERNSELLQTFKILTDARMNKLDKLMERLFEP